MNRFRLWTKDRVNIRSARLAGALASAGFLCLAALSLTGAAEPPATFARDVAPILQANCQECHRPGGIGPFSLLTYDDAQAMGEAIKDVTSRRVMPPWKAAPGFGEFHDERRLTEAQIKTLARWVDAGAPLGDPSELPPPRQFTEGWMLGKPDLVLEPDEAYEVPADGYDEYRNFVLPYQPATDQWLTAVEVSPGSAAVMHHVVLFVDTDGQTPDLDDADPGPGFTVPGTDAGFSPALFIDAWAPGSTPRHLAEGTAWRVPAGSRLVMQVHYHPNGETQQDRTKIGLHFARGPIDKRVRTSTVQNLLFRIPAGAKRHRVNGSLRVPMDITLLSAWPHMHLLGKEMKVSATLPGAVMRPVVWVPDWDFHWQQVYALKEPMKLPAGSRLDLTAYYDNSEENPHNPNTPPQLVTFGPQTTDEMCFCFVRYTVDREHLTSGVAVENDLLEIAL